MLASTVTSTTARVVAGLAGHEEGGIRMPFLVRVQNVHVGQLADHVRIALDAIGNARNGPRLRIVVVVVLSIATGVLVVLLFLSDQGIVAGRTGLLLEQHKAPAQVLFDQPFDASIFDPAYHCFYF